MHFDGWFQANVTANGRSCTAKLMVSTVDTPLIIGCDLINTLEFGVQGSLMVHGVQQDAQCCVQQSGVQA